MSNRVRQKKKNHKTNYTQNTHSSDNHTVVNPWGCREDFAQFLDFNNIVAALTHFQ